MKAVALFSGGLDSLLAIRIIELQGIEVIPITFITHFFNNDRANKIAYRNNLNLITIDISHKHFDISLHPKYGYGKGFNPCIDCHALMIKEAYNYMCEIGGFFLITGEVLGQRPKSQTKTSLSRIDKLTNLGDITLRPLSAKLLKPTMPEREGVVDRNKLYGISGRSREIQLKLAEKFKITEYGSSGGGCILTNKATSKRLFIALKECNIEESLIKLLLIGRHFRLNNSLFIVSRNKEEGEVLRDYDSAFFYLSDIKGPTGKLILCGKNFNGQSESSLKDDTLLAAKVLARYAGDGIVKVKLPDDIELLVEPLDKYICERLLIK
jgi:tRNA-specific 2-thiouridylase